MQRGTKTKGVSEREKRKKKPGGPLPLSLILERQLDCSSSTRTAAIFCVKSESKKTLTFINSSFIMCISCGLNKPQHVWRHVFIPHLSIKLHEIQFCDCHHFFIL